MAISFTEQQEKVIQAKQCNVLVSAAAGSGKTAVLVERIIRMICDEQNPIDVDRLLVVTFTNAAAAQMRERIGKAIEQRLNEEPDNVHLQRQASLLHNAQITTIHSFCLFVIRNHFHTIGLDPTFRVADEAELKLLKQDVMKQLLESRFEKKEEDFLRCLEYFCLNGRDSILEQHILDLYTFAMSYPWPKEWLEERKKDYKCKDKDEFNNSLAAKYLKKILKRQISDLCLLLEQASDICDLPDGPYMYGEKITEDMEYLEKISALNTLEEFEQNLNRYKFADLPRKKDETVDPQKREVVKELRKQVKEELQKLQKKFFFIPLSDSIEHQKECSNVLCVLIDLVLEFKVLLDQAKREKKVLDFNDFEHFALDILLEQKEDGIYTTAAAAEYRSYFKEVLIDEYQDSNMVQEYLLKAVSGEDEHNYNRFMVGDVKQSIYRFRLAKPALFLEKYHTYDMETGEKCRIDLRQNFRSRKEVLSSVNTVFEKIMTEQIGGIMYDQNAALYPAAVYPENVNCNSEYIIVEKPDKESGLSEQEAEALAIAKKIKELKKDFQITDDGTRQLRPVEFRDIVILLRGLNGWDDEFKRILMKEGIPAYVMSKTGYFGAKEIQTILQFLKVLDNPLQDIPFYGVMTSAFGGFTEEEVAMIRSVNKKIPLYHCVKNAATEQEKCRKLLEAIDDYRKESICVPVSRLLRKILKDYNYVEYVSALPGGEQRKANVEMLLEKAVEFEALSFYGLFHFIRYIEQLDKYDVDYGEANILDENADVVRIMSIHKSKGLEFPVTFVSGFGKRFNTRDSSQSFLVDDELGIGMNYVDLEHRVKCKTLRRNILSEKLFADNMAEELRILYVAMTRAKEKLILTGIMKEPEERCEMEKVKKQIRKGKSLLAFEVLDSTCYWDFVLPSIGEISGEIFSIQELMENAVVEQVESGIQKEKLKTAKLNANNEIVTKLKHAFVYRYTHEDLRELYTKTSVSELKMAAMEEMQREAYLLMEEKEFTPYIPNFKKQDESVSGTLRGSAVHKVMEIMDFVEYKPQKEWVEEYLQKQVTQGRLTKEYYELVPCHKISHFLDTTLAKRMSLAEKKQELYREQPFVYGIKANRLADKFPANEIVLIQGIIDAFFEEDGELVLLDYKTDMVNNPEELIKRYKTQIDYYEEALEKLTGKKVKERILYSFYLGVSVNL